MDWSNSGNMKVLFTEIKIAKHWKYDFFNKSKWSNVGNMNFLLRIQNSLSVEISKFFFTEISGHSVDIYMKVLLSKSFTIANRKQVEIRTTKIFFLEITIVKLLKL